MCIKEVPVKRYKVHKMKPSREIFNLIVSDPILSCFPPTTVKCLALWDGVCVRESGHIAISVIVEKVRDGAKCDLFYSPRYKSSLPCRYQYVLNAAVVTAEIGRK